MSSEDIDADSWDRFADLGRGCLVGTAILGPLWQKDDRTSFDGLTAILAASAATKAIKAIWREPRPNGQNNNSFPSQHAADCFAAAAILDRKWKDTIGPVAFGLATAISLGRVFSGKHHAVDVIAGGALGIIAGEVASHYSA